VAAEVAAGVCIARLAAVEQTAAVEAAVVRDPHRRALAYASSTYVAVEETAAREGRRVVGTCPWAACQAASPAFQASRTASHMAGSSQPWAVGRRASWPQDQPAERPSSCGSLDRPAGRAVHADHAVRAAEGDAGGAGRVAGAVRGTRQSSLDRRRGVPG
jgi:hypothetical protein